MGLLRNTSIRSMMRDCRPRCSGSWTTWVRITDVVILLEDCTLTGYSPRVRLGLYVEPIFRPLLSRMRPVRSPYEREAAIPESRIHVEFEG